MRTEVIGDATLLAELVPVFEQMRCAGFERQVLNRVVQRIPIDVVDDMPGGDSAVCLHPNELRSSKPDIRIGYLHEGAAFILSCVAADHDRAHRHFAQGRLPALPFGGGRKVNAFHAAIPRHVPSCKSIGGTLASPVLIALEPRSRQCGQARSGVPFATALERAEPRSSSAIRLDGEDGRTGLACFTDHVGIVAHHSRSCNGSGTVGVAYRQPRLFAEPAPKAVQEALL